MLEFFTRLFDPSDFPARWTCGLWSPGHGWLHIISDTAIWGAYMAIPALLIFFIRRRPDVPFLPIFWLFGAFIFACGTTHLIDATLFWWPAYRFSGTVKAITAIVSWATVFALIPTLPKALELPGIQAANQILSGELTRLRNFLNSVPGGILVVDAQGKIVMSNSECAEIFGYESEEFQAQSLELLVPAHIRKDHPALRHSYFQSPVKRPMGKGRDLAGLRKDGSSVPLEIGLNPIDIRGEQHVVASILDISERRAQEASHRRLASMVDAANDIIIGIGHEGIIRSWNKGAEALLGIARDETIGKKVRQYLGHGSFPEEDFEGVLSGQVERATFEATLCTQSGAAIEVEISMNSLDSETVGETEAVMVARDLTETKRSRLQLLELNSELERSNAELEEYASVTSHDMRTPLDAIGALAGWVIEDVQENLPPESRRHLEQIQERVERLNAMMDDILTHARIQPGGGLVEEISITETIRDIYDSFGPSESIDFRVESSVEKIYTERIPFELVVRNLLGNAIKHHDRGDAKITVHCRDTDHFYEVEFEDDGPGIDPAFHEKIFHVFETLKPKDEAGGSGMGLAFVKKTIDTQGGAIRLESSEGTGARFIVHWPKREV